MSYLLTEIALDMLGYKFYDINGIYQITDFQTMTGITPSENTEIPLEQIIYPDGQHRATDINSTDSEECIEIPNSNSSNSQISKNKEQLVKLNIKDLVNKEVESLRKEIYYNKTKFIEDNIRMVKKKDKTSKITPKDLLKPYNERERKSIYDEAEMLGEFLNCVEKRLEEANPEQFKVYKKYRMEEFL